MSNIFSIVPIELLTDESLTPSELKVVICLLSFRNKATNAIYPGIEKIAERLGWKDKTRVSKTTSSLVKKGWLKKKKRGFNSSNEYEVIFPEHLLDQDDEQTDQVGESDQLGESNQTQFGQTDQHQFGQTDQPNRQINKQNNRDSSESKIPPCPHEAIIDLYHEILPELDGVLKSSWPGSQRERDLRARWKSHSEHQKLEFWRWFFSEVRMHPHYMGDNPRNWKPNLAWLVNRRRFDEVLERGVNRLKREGQM